MTDEYWEGFNAAKSSASIDDNPYDPFGTDKDFEDWGEWEDGFFAFCEQ